MSSAVKTAFPTPPRQLLIYQALQLTPPEFAHLPFLLGKDRSKLSKRKDPVNLLEFRDQGVMPQAMMNYLALLGWNPGEGETQEIFTRDELISRFTLQGVNRAGAIFDVEKLAWMNVQYLKAMPVEEFLEHARPLLEPTTGPLDASDPYTREALELGRERIHQLSDIVPGVSYFFRDDYELDPAGVAKHLGESTRSRLEALQQSLSELSQWDPQTIEDAVRALAGRLGCKPAELIHPARMAVSGRTVGPSVFHLLAALGRDRVLGRLARAT